MENKMVIRTVRLKRPLLTVTAALVTLTAVILLCTVLLRGTGSAGRVLETEEQRQAFMREMGWEVGEEYVSVREVLIPEDWNEVYENYNKLQREQGFDLSRYRGRAVEVYTYEVRNYPGYPEGVICDLMVCDGRLIGGDVCSIALEGFMQGLRKQ